jgi:hypothetical protein
MSRHEQVLTVFVASPNDVGDERTRLEEVVNELNATWSRDLCVRLDLIRWETHAYPGIAEDAQAVINDQIPGDYDIFVGIMWCHYGTPTNRAGSGTVEEFERAKARYDSDPSCVKFMIYFKDAPIPPSRLDPIQLAKVNVFRKSLGDEGVLYWNFISLEQFEKLLRLHLTRQVQAWKTQQKQSLPNNIKTKCDEQGTQLYNQDDSDDDLGILDLIEIIEDRFGQLTAITERIGNATTDLGDKMSQNTAQINQLKTASQGNVDRKAAKRLISIAASDMNEYTARMEAEVPIFSHSLNEGMNAMVRAASMSVEIETKDTTIEQRNDGLQAITSLLEVLTTSKESIMQFREVTAALPRMTSELNKAKRGLVSVLDKLIAEFSNGQSILRESEEIVRNFPCNGKG